MRFLKKKTEINPCDFVTCSGSRKKKIYSPFYDGKKLCLVESGETDIQDMINAYAPECDINLILTRLAHGDMSVLNSHKPMFADFRNLPTDFRGVLDVALRAEQQFNSLPLDIRKKFDNDYRRYVFTAGTSEWNEIMGITRDGVLVTPDQAEKEVIADA